MNHEPIYENLSMIYTFKHQTLQVGYKLGQRTARCNYKIQLDSQKIADTVDIEDIGEKKAFCRCWKSEKWPYCDGSQGKHNKETGDNVGPLIVKSEKK